MLARIRPKIHHQYFSVSHHLCIVIRKITQNSLSGPFPSVSCCGGHWAASYSHVELCLRKQSQKCIKSSQGLKTGDLTLSMPGKKQTLVSLVPVFCWLEVGLLGQALSLLWAQKDGHFPFVLCGFLTIFIRANYGNAIHVLPTYRSSHPHVNFRWTKYFMQSDASVLCMSLIPSNALHWGSVAGLSPTRRLGDHSSLWLHRTFKSMWPPDTGTLKASLN